MLKMTPHRLLVMNEYTGGLKWRNGILAKDGNIYACPVEANQILQINIEKQSTHLVGPDLGPVGDKWMDFVEGEDDILYGIPFFSNELLRFDPIKHTATLIPLKEELQGKSKWWGGVKAENGFIYGIPLDRDKVLSIAPLKFRP